jgi:hypothetical protein
MRYISLVLFLVLVPIGPVSATPVWDFSWSSEVLSSHGTTPDGGCCEPAHGLLAGTSTATLTRLADRLAIDFQTPAGPARAEINTGGEFPFGFSLRSALPVDVPANLPGYQPTGGATGIALAIFPELEIAAYTWTGGSFADPETFSLRVYHHGSTVDPLFDFRGTGTRRALAADEPAGVGLVALAAMLALAAVRAADRGCCPGRSPRVFSARRQVAPSEPPERCL